MAHVKKAKVDDLELKLFGSTAPLKEEDEEKTVDDSDSEVTTESDRSGSDSEGEAAKKLEKRKRKLVKRMEKVPETSKNLNKNDDDALWDDEDDQEQTLSKGFMKQAAPDTLIALDLGKKATVEKFSSKIREQFLERSKLGQKPEWLSKIEDEEEKKGSDVDSDEDEAMQGLFALQKSTGKYIGRAAMLPKSYLQANKIPDPTMANHDSTKKVKVIRFHPTEPVLITANTIGTLQLFQITKSIEDLQVVKGKSFLQEARFKKFKIDSLDFFDDNSSILLTSHRNDLFYTYDLLNGHVTQHTYPKNIYREKGTGLRSRLSADGEFLLLHGQGAELHVFNRSAMEHLHTFVAADHIIDSVFSPNNNDIIYALTETGVVYIWNLKAKGEQKVFRDLGCVRATCFQISKNEQFLAIGQNTGIVNVYNVRTIHSDPEPKPLQTYTNLTTSVSFLTFSRDSQMLAMGSDEKPMAYRIAHVQSSTVFLNFPPKNEVLAKATPTCATFSPNSAFVAFGTKEGGVRLYRLSYFDKY